MNIVSIKSKDTKVGKMHYLKDIDCTVTDIQELLKLAKNTDTVEITLTCDIIKMNWLEEKYYE